MNRAGLMMPLALSPDEAACMQRHHDRLRQALAARDRGALRDAKQAVIREAYHAPRPGAPALRQALRLLCWRMAAWRLPRGAERTDALAL